MKHSLHAANSEGSGLPFAPMFTLEPFIPVPLVIELSTREGWAAFTEPVRDRDLKPLIREEARRGDTGGERVRNLFHELFPDAQRGDGLEGVPHLPRRALGL